MAPPLAVAADDERNAAPATVQRGERFGTGCLICRKEDHEDQILLCELCDGEYHTYCLQPALTVVPEENWYCGAFAHSFVLQMFDALVVATIHPSIKFPQPIV